MILVFGGGDMAEKGIIPIVGGISITEKMCDVRWPSDVKEVFKQRKPKVVINCAGVSRPAPMKSASIKGLLDEIETNLLGSFWIARYAAEQNCKMIFIASVAGLFGKPNHAGYSASKGGVISLVESLAMEGHEAYVISPGRVNTRMRQKDYPNDKPGTRLEPTEIGEVVKDILDGKYKSGDNIIIRRIGFETVPIKVDRNEQWRSELKVGEPVTL